MVWDSIQGSDDYNVPERAEKFSGSAWSSGDRRKKLCRRFSKPSRKHSGVASQRSLRTRLILKISKENLCEESTAIITTEALPQPRPAGKPVIWNDLTNGAVVSKSTSSQQLATSNQLATLSGRESMSGREDVKVEPSILGSDGLRVYMSDPLYSEDDASIETTTCHFTLGDVDSEESGLPLFGNGSDEGKIDYTWDNCFGNLEDVDNLLSSGPDSDFGPVNSSSDGLQWHESASPPALQPDNHLSRAISPPGADCEAKGNVDVFDMKMEFVPVPVDVGLPSPAVEKEKELSLSVKDPNFSSPASNFVSNLQNPQEQKQRQQPQPAQLSAVLDARDGLHTGKSQAGQADRNLASKRMEITVNGPESSSLYPSDSEKASMAQAHRARRHAVNRKRCEERTKRQLTQRKTVHGVPYGSPQVPQHLQSIPLQLSSPAHLHQASSPTLHTYQATSSTLSPCQPLVQPTAPFRHGGYVPPMHLMPSVAPPSVPPQMQAQGVYLGYQQQPGAFSQPMPHHPRHPVRPPGEIPIRPATSGPTMTPQEKIEKLRFLQQMQARLAVEQQQQQFASQNVALDSRVPSKGHAQLPQCLSISQVDVAVTSSDLGRAAASESDFEQSLSVGQTSVEATSDDEGGSLEAGVLEQLQNSMKTLEGGTKLCIRDALYRLARSAMKRQASSGERAIGGEAGSSSSEDADTTSTGLEASINSDPSSSSRVSRMNVSMEETQTNPIDRSIAHLLFHKRPRQPGPAPASGPGPVQGPYTPVNDGQIAATQTCLAGPSNSPPVWQQGNLARGNWAGAQMNPIGGVIPKMAVGVGPVPLLCAPMSYDPRLASTSVLRLQAGPNLGVCHQALEQQSGCMSSTPLVTDSSLTGGHLQGNNVGSAMLVGDLPSPGGSQLCGGTAKELRYTHAQVLPPSGQREAYEGRSNLRSKRLQHAGGLGELSQLLTEGLDVGSESSPMGRGESGVASGPPGSQSSGSGECQAGSFLKKLDILAEREIPGKPSEKGQFCHQEEGLKSC